MSDRALLRLRDALEACEAIETFLAASSLSDYLSNYGLRLQIERLLEIIGEALNQADLTDEQKEHSIRDIRAIIGMRNRIIHGYSEIDNELIWLTATRNVPQLRDQLKAMLGE